MVETSFAKIDCIDRIKLECRVVKSRSRVGLLADAGRLVRSERSAPDADRRLRHGRVDARARPRGRPEGATAPTGRAPPPARPDAGDDLREAVAPDARLLRDRDRAARRPGR